MAQTKQRFQSFEEYLFYDDGTDNLYELFNGELILVPPESGRNTAIAVFLLLQFAAIVGHLRVRPHGLEIEVRGEPRNRYPELTIIKTEHIQQLDRRNTLRLSMAPPLLVIEIVSPGELQHERDYIAKRAQYQERGIPEYWVINPQIETVLVLELTETVYSEVGTFSGSDCIRSPLLEELNLTASQIFAAGSNFERI
ncbi:MAG: Uma2 family endonuclease [Chroococcidiopsidaceae cyanobacterium CP_BM_RX_35]|nr:Uma2 family endonuclease [Chroococcidiopsidaceae cyanobacterium CP_BM_RX_35]